MEYFPLQNYLILVAIAGGIGSVLILIRGLPRLSLKWIAVLVVPGVIQLALYCSLAIHMRRSLGAWPAGIGESGFSPSLIAHAAMATRYFEALVITTAFVWPLAVLLCAVVPAWRRWIGYLAAYFLSCLLCIGAMFLAPSPFLNWWLD